MAMHATVLETLLATFRSSQELLKFQRDAGRPNVEQVQASHVAMLFTLIAEERFLAAEDANALIIEVRNP